jgi:hypothetical protein
MRYVADSLKAFLASFFEPYRGPYGDGYRGKSNSATRRPPKGGSGVLRVRTIKDPAQPPDNITIEQARAAARAVRERRLAGQRTRKAAATRRRRR